MYERTLDDQVLTFGHEGVLYKGSFILYDKQTDSKWVHVTAECVKGPLKGRRLEMFPSVVVRWESWKKRYPDTQVLGGQRVDGFMGTFAGLQESELPDYGLAVVKLGHARLYPFGTLLELGVIEDDFGGEPIVVTFSRSAGIARAFSREVDGETVQFELLPDTEEDELLIKDLETDTVWDGLSGTAEEGAFEGETLRSLICYPILRSRFEMHYARGTVHGDTPSDDE